MKQQYTVIFTLLIIMLSNSLTNAYQCYGCFGISDSSCNDPFDATKFNPTDYLTTNSTYPLCVKMTVTGFVIRTIGNGTVCPSGINECVKRTTNGVTGTICCCDSDLCNGVSSIQPQSFILISFISTFTVFIYRLL